MRNTRTYYNLAGILLCMLAIVLVAACSGGGSNGSSAGNGNAPSENGGANEAGGTGEAPVVTALMGRQTNFPEDNPVIRAIREQSGVNLEVSSVVNEDYENRLNTLIVSRSTPDIFNVSKTKLLELVENGVIQPLDDLLEAHGPHILENKGDYLRGPAYIDGQVYGLPGGFFSGNALALRKDWLDNLGLDVPTTLEEYREVLRAFVQDDPNRTGQNDTIGLGVAIEVDNTWEHIFAAYGVPLNRQMLVDGEVIPWMLLPGYMDAVKFLNELYHEGLIDPEFATVPTLQSFEKLWNGTVGAYQFNADGITQNWLSRYVEDPLPEFVYTMIEGPDGHGGHLRPVLEDSGSYTVLSSAADNPEAAIQLLDFLISDEGNSLTWAGVEDMHYLWNDEGEFEWIPPYDDAVQLRDAGGYMYSVLHSPIGGLREALFNDITREARQNVMDYVIEDVYIYEVPDITQQRGTILSDMEKEFRTLAITTSGNLDALYEDFKAKYLAEGGEKWIEQATEIYEREQAALAQ